MLMPDELLDSLKYFPTFEVPLMAMWARQIMAIGSEVDCSSTLATATNVDLFAGFHPRRR